MNHARIRALLAIVMLLIAAPAHAAERRIALVIGEAAYSAASLGRLTGTRRDADRMEAALRAAGFAEVLRRDDLGKAALAQAISDFARRLADAGPDAVGFLYYSGHGMADTRRGANFLIPIDADIRSAVDLPLYAQPMDDVLDAVESAGAKAVFVVFDACRSSPSAISRGGKGLLPMRGRSDTLVAFATAPGETAADDGLYASVLAEELRRPGSESTTLFQRVQNLVAKRTERQQVPQFTSSLVETVQFVLAAAPVAAAVPAGLPRDPADEDARDWATAFRAGTRAAFAGYLARHPGGVFAAEAQRRIAAFDQPAMEIVRVPQGNPALPPDSQNKPEMNSPQSLKLEGGYSLSSAERSEIRGLYEQGVLAASNWDCDAIPPIIKKIGSIIEKDAKIELGDFSPSSYEFDLKGAIYILISKDRKCMAVRNTAQGR